MLLIFPPVSKPCEPPAGLAAISGALLANGVDCFVLDANLEGLCYLLGLSPAWGDTWTRRAVRHLPAHLRGLRSREGYQLIDSYRRSVADVNRVLEKAAGLSSVRVGLANYADRDLSPLRSVDLLQAAENPERNPFYPYLVQRLAGILEEGAAGTVGISICYLSQALTGFAAAGILRRLDPDVRIIMGGGLVTSWMSRPGWNNPFGGLVDEMVAGAGEKPLLALLGKDTGNGDRLPDYGFCRTGDYFAPGFILPYSASSGCYWGRCSFCPERAENGLYRATAPQTAMDNVRKLASKLNPCLIHFLDNAMSPALLKRIAEQGLGVPWYGFARVSDELGDPDFCRALRASGCVMLQLGLESGDQDVLDRLEKGITLNGSSRVLEALKRAGIGTYVYLLFGTPPETLESAEQTLRFIVEHHRKIDFLNTALFNMPVHGPDSADYKSSAFYDADLTLYTGFSHPSGWDRPQIRSFLQKRFFRHPAISTIIHRDPPVFTSSHAPFFL